jgi:hypothetical protein
VSERDDPASSRSTAAILREVGPETWRTFYTHWGWTTPRVRPVQPAVKVPVMLLEFHETVGQVQMNHLTPLLRLGADEEGFVIIYTEEQGIFDCALREADLGAENPPVWRRYNERGADWALHARTLSLFLTQVLVLDAVVQGISEFGFHTPADVPSAEAQRVLAPMERLPWSSSLWPAKTAVYAGDGTVAMVSGDGRDWCLVYAGARSAEALEPFRKLAVGDDWTWDAPT